MCSNVGCGAHERKPNHKNTKYIHFVYVRVSLLFFFGSFIPFVPIRISFVRFRFIIARNIQFRAHEYKCNGFVSHAKLYVSAKTCCCQLFSFFCECVCLCCASCAWLLLAAVCVCVCVRWPSRSSFKYEFSANEPTKWQNAQKCSTINLSLFANYFLSILLYHLVAAVAVVAAATMVLA